MKRRKRDDDERSFSSGGFWRPIDRSGRARTANEAGWHALNDCPPPKRGVIARLINRENRR
ncbi:hypothetical protein [Streptomyces sp. RTd22]|uniref:hypothetical protein n=1 Tax=Streptomyces sp. RTd22 TaxID=1841249 RepID=UPI0007C5D475|nr:hypothetical protein [Streptomyces sp. RTd22]